jgi:ABC-type transporter Mla maintaining outer membrane lipid asymmetry ATPase subunit MlaF
VKLIGAVPPPPAFDWPGPLDLDIPAGRTTVIWTLPSLAHPLIRLSVGLRTPAVGRVFVLGVEAGLLPRYEGMTFRRRLGVAMQPGGLISNVNLRTNLIVPLLYAGIADMDASQVLVDDALDAVGIARWADRRPSDVPPEVRQAAIVARALVRRPELLLLEAPFRALRVKRGDELLNLCRQRAGTVVIVETENEPWLFERADVLVTLDERGARMERDEVGTI